MKLTTGCTKMTSSPYRRSRSNIALNFDELLFILFSREIEDHNAALKQSETKESSTEVESEKIETLNAEEEKSCHSDESLEIQLILSNRIHHEESSKDSPNTSTKDIEKVLVTKTPPKPRPRTIFLSQIEILAQMTQEAREVPFG